MKKSYVYLASLILLLSYKMAWATEPVTAAGPTIANRQPLNVERQPIHDQQPPKQMTPTQKIAFDKAWVWNGQWRTTVPNQMSVCGTVIGVDVKAGPIWNNDDAKEKCPIKITEWRDKIMAKYRQGEKWEHFSQ
ncbi:MAG: mannan-binding lectin [Pseudomonadota bacterium]